MSSRMATDAVACDRPCEADIVYAVIAGFEGRRGMNPEDENNDSSGKDQMGKRVGRSRDQNSAKIPLKTPLGERDSDVLVGSFESKQARGEL